jgi:putative hydroxymethylpyrimidine transport system ATP-binding protein
MQDKLNEDPELPQDELSSSMVEAPGLCIVVEELTFDGDPLFVKFQLDLRPGEWTCLLGDGGSGKSTLLRIAAGQDVGAGRYRAVLADGGAATALVALMDGQASLEPLKTVLENACGDPMDSLIPTATLREEAKELLAVVGLAERTDDPTAILSTGMRQRVALVRALLSERPIVLLDEPFAALDRGTRLHMQELAREVLVGCTVLHVTGDPSEAVRLADRIVLLQGRPGRLAEFDLPPGAAPRMADQPEVEERAAALLDRLMAG